MHGSLPISGAIQTKSPIAGYAGVWSNRSDGGVGISSGGSDIVPVCEGVKSNADYRINWSGEGKRDIIIRNGVSGRCVELVAVSCSNKDSTPVSWIEVGFSGRLVRRHNMEGVGCCLNQPPNRMEASVN